MAEMSKRERVAAAIAGERPDRAPVSFWGHDYGREWSAEEHAAQTLAFVQQYDFDYVKINPRFSYLMEAWGALYAKSDLEREGPKPVRLPVRSIEDLGGIDAAPGWAPSLVEQLTAIQRIVRGLRGDRPVMQTVFNPLSVLGRMVEGEGGDRAAGQRRLRAMLAESAVDVHAALAAITETLSEYAVECLNAGADGIFYATVDWGTRDACTAEQYLEFGRPYDLQILGGVRDAELLMLHVCKDNNMLELLLDYPVHAFNWDAHGKGNPGLGEIAKKAGLAVAGGIAPEALATATPEQVAELAREAVAETGGRRLLLAGACSIRPDTPEANIRAALAAVRG